MSRTLSIQISDDAYSALQQQAEQFGVLTENLAQRIVQDAVGATPRPPASNDSLR